jgi:hypothetical protein
MRYRQPIYVILLEAGSLGERMGWSGACSLGIASQEALIRMGSSIIRSWALIGLRHRGGSANRWTADPPVRVTHRTGPRPNPTTASWTATAHRSTNEPGNSDQPIRILPFHIFETPFFAARLNTRMIDDIERLTDLLLTNFITVHFSRNEPLWRPLDDESAPRHSLQLPRPCSSGRGAQRGLLSYDYLVWIVEPRLQ